MTDDKAKVMEELKGLLRDKDAESARLRAEINRLRQALGQNDKLQASNNQEVQQLQQQLQEALTLNKAHERHALLSNANAASGSPRAETVRLQAELEGQVALVARLQAELASHQTASSARVAELQDSFASKVQNMRQANQEQLAAAAREAKEREAALQAQLDAANKAATSHTDETAQLRRQLEEAQQAAATAAAEAASKLAREQARAKELEGKVTALEEQLRQRTAGASGGVGTASAGSTGSESAAAAAAAQQQQQHDMSEMSEVMAMMERQLGRLSETIRAKNGEVTQLTEALHMREAQVAQLQATVQAGIDERRELQAQLARQLQAAQQQQQAMQAAGSPGGSDGSPALMPKPLRTSPLHKAKFR